VVLIIIVVVVIVVVVVVVVVIQWHYCKECWRGTVKKQCHISTVTTNITTGAVMSVSQSSWKDAFISSVCLSSPECNVWCECCGRRRQLAFQPGSRRGHRKCSITGTNSVDVDRECRRYILVAKQINLSCYRIIGGPLKELNWPNLA